MTVRSPNSRKISSRLKDPYCKTGYKYAEDVVSGKIPACLYVRQACQRAIDDFNNQDQTPYTFDQNAGGRICRFIELLPHVKGPLVNHRIKLERWQVFCLVQIFSWLDELGFRRFRRALIIVPRGNGKTVLASGIGLYMFAADAQQADCFVAATTRDQAALCYGDAAQMVRKSPDLASSLGIEIDAKGIWIRSRNSQFKALSSESHTLDGLNISLGILDELAQHPDSRVYDAITTGAGKRPTSLILSITTAGALQTSPGYQQAEHLKIVLSGQVDDPQLFGVFYTIDADDDWTDEKVWVKANPNWGVSVEPSYVSQLGRKAQQIASDAPAFKTKHLDVWVASDFPFIDMLAYLKCADKDLTIDDFKGEPCWIGVDLASRVDLAARVIIFRRMVEGMKHVYVFGRGYLPEATIHTSTIYQGWAMRNLITASMGETNDFKLIKDDLMGDARNYQVQGIAFDPWQASAMMQDLLMEGMPVQEMPQRTANLSAPMKEMQALIASRRFHHNGDEVMGYCMSNLVAHLDVKDNVFPRKNLPTQKIDLAVATIFALALEMAEPELMDQMPFFFVPF